MKKQLITIAFTTLFALVILIPGPLLEPARANNEGEEMHQPFPPQIGDQFPELTVHTTHGRVQLPEDYSGSWFVLFSHPGDFTPVCTTEFVAFQKRYDDFQALDTELIGLSVDQVHAHIKWVEWIKDNLGVEITFPIIADDIGKVARTLGMIHPKKGPTTVRSVYIVDDQGKIRAILQYPQELGRNIDEIVRMVRGLQTAQENQAAIPANWPNNELIGKRLIVPPAMDQATAETRSQEYECYDWWFCHKEADE